jgi:hypothetical protein
VTRLGHPKELEFDFSFGFRLGHPKEFAFDFYPSSNNIQTKLLLCASTTSSTNPPKTPAQFSPGPPIDTMPSLDR